MLHHYLYDDMTWHRYCNCPDMKCMSINFTLFFNIKECEINCTLILCFIYILRYEKISTEQTQCKYKHLLIRTQIAWMISHGFQITSLTFLVNCCRVGLPTPGRFQLSIMSWLPVISQPATYQPTMLGSRVLWLQPDAKRCGTMHLLVEIVPAFKH